jgi:uncharacterized membrane protein YeaQ/YmgE (transglycosylase-associated protein family)
MRIRPIVGLLAGWLADRAIDRALRAVLPQVLERLDREVPVLLRGEVPPATVQGVIGSAIADALGRPARADQIDAVARIFNPVAAALSAQLRNR